MPLGALRGDASDQCGELPDVPDVDSCLVLVVTPSNASDDCPIVEVDQSDQRDGKLQRGARIPVTVDCSGIDGDDPGTAGESDPDGG